VVFALLLTGCYTANTVPISKSQDQVRDWMLARTPLGCSPDRVYILIKQHQWQIDEDVKKDGTLRQFVGHLGNQKVVASYVRCDLGITHYVYFPFPTDVLVTWAFDKDDQLMDVWVDQQTVGDDSTMEPIK
jgi:hypothetical protein